MYIRNCWYVFGWSHELVGDVLLARTIIGEPLLVYRCHDGELTALEDSCCHRQAPLSLGRREGDAIRCMYHGLKFEHSGKCIEIPGQNTVPPDACVRRYPCVQRHGFIWVWMGTPGLADELLIPALVGPDNPDWSMRSGQIEYLANHQLITDNLCDLSHLSFVHEKTLSAGDPQFAQIRPRVSSIDRGIRVERWMFNAPRRSYEADARQNETWLTYDYVVPGVLSMRTEEHPVGTAEASDLGPPKTQPIRSTCTSQAVTAVTDATTRYFFCWGPRSCEVQENPELPDRMFALLRQSFDEDRVIIEAQYRNQKLRMPQTPLFISHDRGPMLMQQVTRKLLEDEASSGSHAA